MQVTSDIGCGVASYTDAKQTTEYQLIGKLGERFPRLRANLLELFAVDLRTLGVARLALAFILLVGLLLHISELKVFYSDDGLLPRSAAFGSFYTPWNVSLHFLSGRVEVEALMLAIALVFALMLIVGYKTRLASFWSWLLLASLHARNPFVIHGGDSLLRMLLFWGIFVPWGARYSIESALNPERERLPKNLISIGTVALLAQIPLVYFFTGLLKNGREWRHDFTAISYVLNAPDYARPLGTWLATFPSFLKVVTAGTLMLEIGCSLLLFSPFFTKAVRPVAIGAFLCLQLGFVLTLKLGLFPLVSTAALLPFVPGWFWDRLSALAGKRGQSRAYDLIRRTRQAVAPALAWLRPKPFRVKQPLILTLLCALFFAYVVIDNMGSIKRSPIRIPLRFSFIGQTLRIHQRWTLFAPGPFKVTSWYVIDGTLPDGRIVALFDGAPDSPTNPDNRQILINSYDWRSYWFWMGSDQGRYLGPYAARYFCNVWNNSHVQEALAKVTVHKVEKPVSINGPENLPTVGTFLEYQCPSKGAEPEPSALPKAQTVR